MFHFRLPSPMFRRADLWFVCSGLTTVLLCVPMLPADEVSFDLDVAPLLAAHCLDCHGASEPQGGLMLFTMDAAQRGGDSGVAVVPGKPDESLLWQRVDSDEMPPRHPLADAEKSVLKRWIQQGAKWGTSPIDPFAVTTKTRAGRDWWALQPLPQTAAAAKPDASVSDQIDEFIEQRLQAAGLKPLPTADPRTLVRRLYYDLLGLPPDPEVVAKFAAQPTEAAWQQLVEQLLASPHYGERWGRHWLDVVRFGESDGFERNFPRHNAWPYRDWVIQAFNDGLPYDQFVRMQLFGDQLQGGLTGAAATGFWVAGVHNTVVGGSDRMKTLARQDEIEEVLAVVGQTFLGLTVNCARCHDHKFDPVTQREFYQLASAVSGLGHGERQETSPAHQQQLATLDQDLKQLQTRLSKLNKAARTQILEARSAGDIRAPLLQPPTPYALWEFDHDFNDSVGELHAKPQGNAVLKDGAVVLDGQSFVETPPLTQNVKEKTLQAWVQLTSLQQRGGGVMTLQTLNGITFDSLVFGERDPGQWLAGSNNFARTDPFQAPQETQAVDRAVQLTLVYQQDGTITAYRDAEPYGRSIRKGDLQPYAAGDSQLIFGLRHKPVGGNRFLTAKIHRAAFYSRALSADEVRASLGDPASVVTDAQIMAWLPEAERKQRAGLLKDIAQMAASREQLASRARQTVYTLQPQAAQVTRVFLRGDPDKVGDTVVPGGISALAGPSPDFQLSADAAETQRRRRLTEWITSADNPLFARVMVNRVWHYHFGQGIVQTPNDFGFNGSRPSHPELLEWLAVRFRDGGFQIRDLHRWILNSSVWRRAAYVARDSQRMPDFQKGLAVDADNRWLWRREPQRLEAEAIRDSMLVVSGQLNAKMGGPAFQDVTIVQNNGTTYYEPQELDDVNVFRRTVYRFSPRGNRSALLDTFDCPDPASAAPKRSVTTTPLQALSLLNNAFVLRMSGYFAQRVAREAGDDVQQQVQRVWQLAVARNPTPFEAQLSETLVRQHGLSALCRGLMNCSEFIVVD